MVSRTPMNTDSPMTPTPDKHKYLTPEIQAGLVPAALPPEVHELDHESQFPKPVILNRLGSWEPKIT